MEEFDTYTTVMAILFRNQYINTAAIFFYVKNLRGLLGQNQSKKFPKKFGAFIHPVTVNAKIDAKPPDYTYVLPT